MAIHDALWACPLCLAIESIRPHKATERCSGCGASFEGGPGAEIIATTPGGPALARSLPEWEKLLPPLDVVAEASPGPVTAIIREAGAPGPVFEGGRLLGWAERFGPKTRATLRLVDGALIIRTGQAEQRLPLDQVTAVQPSSSSVQLRDRSGRLLSLTFPEGSVRLWEARLQTAVRQTYQAAGKGAITEFHPTIRTR